MVLNRGDFAPPLPPRDSWQCLETWLPQPLMASSGQRVYRCHQAASFRCTARSLSTRNYPVPMTIVPRLRNPSWEYLKSFYLLIIWILCWTYCWQVAKQKPLEKIVLDFRNVWMMYLWDYHFWNNYFCIATWSWSIWICYSICFHVIWKKKSVTTSSPPYT